jgi:CheY-specific phosphatase CheX
MNAAISARLAEVATDTLERLAFLFASPAVDASAAEAAAMETVRVDFNGGFTGGLELSLSASVLAELAANMLGADEGQALSADEQRDALKELVNIVCGNLLPAIAGRAEEFAIGTPYPAAADGHGWETPVAVSHLVLEKGVCRLRMRVDGQLPEGLVGRDGEPLNVAGPGGMP